MVAKDGIAQTDVKSLFKSYNGHLKFYKDAIQDGFHNFCTSVSFTKRGDKMVTKDGITQTDVKSLF